MPERLSHYPDNFDDLLPPLWQESPEIPVDDGSELVESIGFIALVDDNLSTGMSLKSNERNRSLASFSTTWKMIELGLTAPTQETRQGFLDIAQERLGLLLRDDTVDLSLRQRALAAHIAIPSFRIRAEDTAPTAKLQAEMYDTLTQLLTNTLQKLPKGFGRNTLATGILCENLVYASLLYSKDTDIFPYPASPREDQSNNTQANHDLYVIRNGKKRAIQVKRQYDSNPNDAMINICLLPIVERKIAEAQERFGRNDRWLAQAKHCPLDVFLARSMSPRKFMGRRPGPEPSSALYIRSAVSDEISEIVRQGLETPVPVVLNSKAAAPKDRKTGKIHHILTAEHAGRAAVIQAYPQERLKRPTLSDAWRSIEFGLTAESEGDTPEYWEEAGAHFEAIWDNPNTTAEERLKIIMGYTALKSFIRRQTGEPITEAFQELTYKRHTMFLRAELEVGTFAGKNLENTPRDLLAENLVYAALLHGGDTKLFPYPTSTREAASHSLYILSGSEKMPLSIKSHIKHPAQYREAGIIPLAVVPVVEKHLRKLRKLAQRKVINPAWHKKLGTVPGDIILAQCMTQDKSLPRCNQNIPSKLVQQVATDICEVVKTRIVETAAQGSRAGQTLKD